MSRDSTLLGSSFRFLTGALLITWLVLPLIPLAIWSFAKGWFYPSLLPKAWSLRAWEYTFRNLWCTSQTLVNRGHITSGDRTINIGWRTSR